MVLESWPTTWVILITIPTAVIKHHDQMFLWRKRFNAAHSYWGKQVKKVKNWRQKLKQRPWKSAVYWLFLCGLLIPNSHSIPDHLPAQGQCHSSWGEPSHINPQSNKMLYRFANRHTLWRRFRNYVLLIKGFSFQMTLA